ncbi:hypothetical protein HZC07_03050 [Candidatus Micrarchaeota archaeon]|nr:hypothetical protein [Candidatus Micrarchaeota archaeon]
MRVIFTLLLLVVMVSIIHAEFLTENVDVTIKNINEDGSAQVIESIKFIMYGNYSNSIYDSGISRNDLSFWSTNTGLKDVKVHVNPAKVDIRDFRLRPQPRTKCNPIQGVCHGELILEYTAYPSYKDNDNKQPIVGTGIFNVQNYKPRTRRYTLNPASLAFTTTPEGNIILDSNVYLTVKLPEGSTALDINPQPQGTAIALPAAVSSISWNDIVLVKFSLIFDVEDSIEKEVGGFFGGIVNDAANLLRTGEGVALLLLVAIIFGSYLYITINKRRNEDV